MQCMPGEQRMYPFCSEPTPFSPSYMCLVREETPLSEYDGHRDRYGGGDDEQLLDDGEGPAGAASGA
eukprot:24391-Eustigmatos_ZCMA.PRE.1